MSNNDSPNKATFRIDNGLLVGARQVASPNYDSRPVAAVTRFAGGALYCFTA